MKNLKVAIVHDWLYTLGGAEKVLASLLKCYPSADVFCLFDFLEGADRDLLKNSKVKTSFLQKMPFARTRHRHYLALMPLAIEQFDLGDYDLILSSSYAVAKGVLTGPDQLHVSYVHSPMRYAWDLQHEYLRASGIEKKFSGYLARGLLHWMRIWDSRTAHGVDEYIANSNFIARRIKKVYGRSAAVIYPPVAVSGALAPRTPKAPGEKGFFLTASRLVPYKNVRAVVEAFKFLPDERLVVVGTGPELHSLKEIAGDNVSFLGFVPTADLRQLMRDAEAFIFAAEEDFGIIVVEAQSEGTPVLALGRGGVKEIVRLGDTPTGMFFEQPHPQLIAETVGSFRGAQGSFTREACYQNAHRFSEKEFEDGIKDFVEQSLIKFSDAAMI